MIQPLTYLKWLLSVAEVDPYISSKANKVAKSPDAIGNLIINFLNQFQNLIETNRAFSH